MNRFTAALMRWRHTGRLTQPPMMTTVPAHLICEVAQVLDAATEEIIDLDEFLTSIDEYIERIELDPRVPIDITDAAATSAWDLLYRLGLGPRVLIHTIGSCELLLFKRYTELMDTEGPEVFEASLDQIRNAQDLPGSGLTPEGIGVASVMISEQVNARYEVDPSDIPGLCDLDPQVLLNATQVVLLAFDLTVRRLSGITS